MADKKPTYWEKEEKSRSKMDYRNAGYSAAEKKAMAARKLAEAKKKTMSNYMSGLKSTSKSTPANMKNVKRLSVPASPTH